MSTAILPVPVKFRHRPDAEVINAFLAAAIQPIITAIQTEFEAADSGPYISAPDIAKAASAQASRISEFYDLCAFQMKDVDTHESETSLLTAIDMLIQAAALSAMLADDTDDIRRYCVLESSDVRATIMALADQLERRYCAVAEERDA